MVHPSPRIARSTSLDSSLEVRNDDVPSESSSSVQRRRFGARRDHSTGCRRRGSRTGLKEAPARRRGVFVARYALVMLKGRVVEPLPLRSLLLRFLDDRAVAAVARERPKQQPLLPPHRRNYQRDQRGTGDGRWPYYVAVRQQQQRVGGKLTLLLLATTPFMEGHTRSICYDKKRRLIIVTKYC